MRNEDRLERLEQLLRDRLHQDAGENLRLLELLIPAEISAKACMLAAGVSGEAANTQSIVDRFVELRQLVADEPADWTARVERLFDKARDGRSVRPPARRLIDAMQDELLEPYRR